MRRSLPSLLVATGPALFVGGFVHDVVFAGIPDPEPTPTMEADYAHHARVASLIRWVGLLVALTGAVASFAPRARQPPFAQSA